MGNAIVCVFGYYPINAKLTPSFKCPFYDITKRKIKLNEGRYFDEEKVFYDITVRNKKCGTDTAENVSLNTERQNQAPHTPLNLLKLRIIKSLGNICSENEIHEIITLLNRQRYGKVSELLEAYILRARETSDLNAVEEIDEIINEIDFSQKIQTEKGENV
jgi:hypothetical protein